MTSIGYLILAGFFRYSSPSDGSSNHPLLPGQQSTPQQPQQPYQGQHFQQPYRAEGFYQPYQGPGQGQDSAGQFASAPGNFAPAPSSHFLSTETDILEDSGNLGDLHPGMGSQPLELTEGELDTPPGSTFSTPRQWGGVYEGASTARSAAGIAGMVSWHVTVLRANRCCLVVEKALRLTINIIIALHVYNAFSMCCQILESAVTNIVHSAVFVPWQNTQCNAPVSKVVQQRTCSLCSGCMAVSCTVR